MLSYFILFFSQIVFWDKNLGDWSSCANVVYVHSSCPVRLQKKKKLIHRRSCLSTKSCVFSLRWAIAKHLSKGMPGTTFIPLNGRSEKLWNVKKNTGRIFLVGELPPVRLDEGTAAMLLRTLQETWAILVCTLSRRLWCIIPEWRIAGGFQIPSGNGSTTPSEIITSLCKCVCGIIRW